jgi:hypothetical protein
MPVIAGNNFRPFNGRDAHVVFIHIDPTTLTRKTLSVGFYRRTPVNSKTTNTFRLTTPFTPVTWGGKWYFGVNYRVKCLHGPAIVPSSVAYADRVAPSFLGSGWILIPHYVNNHWDQGVDFFKCPPEELLFGYLPKPGNDGKQAFDWKTLPENLRDWVEKTVAEAKVIIDLNQ